MAEWAFVCLFPVLLLNKSIIHSKMYVCSATFYRNRQKSMKCDDTNDLWRRKDETPHQFWHNGEEDSPDDESNMCNFLALFYLIVGTLIKGRNLFRVWNLHQFPMILIQVLLLVLLIVPSHRWRISPTKQITIGVSNLFKKGS